MSDVHPTADENAAAARRVVDEGFNQGRVEVLDEVCSQDVVTHDPAEPEDVHGIEAHKERMRMYRTAMPNLRVTVEDVVASGDRVALRWTVSATNTGERQGMPATGKHVEFDGMSIDRFDADGRIAETWDNWDNAGFVQQLGITPEMAAAAG